MYFSLKPVLKKGNFITPILPIKIKIYGFNFIWSLFLEALSATLGGITSSFSLGTSPVGMVVEAKACSKLWEVAPSCGTSAALSEDVSFEASSSFDCSC